MMNIKKAATVGITAFAITAFIPSGAFAANADSIYRINEIKNVMSVNRACSLDELREGLIQIVIKGDCFKWGTIIGGNNNNSGNQNNNGGNTGTNKPEEDKDQGNTNKPEDNIEDDKNQDNNIENDSNEDQNGDNNENDNTEDNNTENKPNDNEINKPDTKPEDNNGQKPILPETDGNENENTNASYAQQVANLVNVERSKEGLAPLTWNQQISKAAAVRAKEIQTSFSHTRPNGSHFATVLKENGVSYRGTGENIAWGQRTPEQVVSAWMNSPGHRANIMNPNFKNIGVGYVENNSKTPYWVQLFTY